MSLFRLDRLATIYLFYPLKRLSWLHKQIHIPILMYHSISDENKLDGYNTAYYQTTTSPNIFNAHMKFLHENNYQVIGLRDLLPLFDLKKKIGEKYIIITFDDGLRDFYSDAFPALHKYGFTATVFLPTGFIGDGEIRKFKGQECLKWGEVYEMHKKGITFGSHTVTHPELRYLSKKEIEYELRSSKEIIEDRIGSTVESFSYPFAFPEEDREFTIKLRGILEGCGYKNGVSTRIGTANDVEDKYFLKRIPVNSYDDIPLFKAKLEGGYNWLYKPQYTYKIMRNIIINYVR